MEESIGLTREKALEVAKLVGMLAVLGRESAAKEAYEMLKAEMAEKKLRKKEKKRKQRQAIAAGGVKSISPRSREKKLKALAKDVEKKRKEDEEKRELALQKLPSLQLDETRYPLPISYPHFRSNMHLVVNNVYKPAEKWGTMTAGRHHQIIEMVRTRFKNGARIALDYMTARIAKQMSDRRNNKRQVMRVWVRSNNQLMTKQIQEMKCPDSIPPYLWAAFLEDELQLRAFFKKWELEEMVDNIAVDPVQFKKDMQRWNAESDELGLPPKNLIDAKDQVQTRKEATHRMGQGGTNRLSAEFGSSSSLLLSQISPMPKAWTEFRVYYVFIESWSSTLPSKVVRCKSFCNGFRKPLVQKNARHCLFFFVFFVICILRRL